MTFSSARSAPSGPKRTRRRAAGQPKPAFSTHWRLEAASIPYMVAGSHASSYHGQPRATQDVDLVIDPSPQQFDEFLALNIEGVIGWRAGNITGRP